MEMWIIAAISAVCGVFGAALSFAGFWLMLGSRLGKIESSSSDAFRVAAESENDVKDSRAALADLATEFSKYREYALEKYVSYTVLTQIELRLAEAQAKAEGRLILAIDRLSGQFDRLLEKAVVAAARAEGA